MAEPTVEPSPQSPAAEPVATDGPDGTVMTDLAGTEEEPMIVRLDTPTSALILLAVCISVTCAGVMTVMSFRN